jgi:hypothetical protein
VTREVGVIAFDTVDSLSMHILAANWQKQCVRFRPPHAKQTQPRENSRACLHGDEAHQPNRNALLERAPVRQADDDAAHKRVTFNGPLSR